MKDWTDWAVIIAVILTAIVVVITVRTIGGMTYVVV